MRTTVLLCAVLAGSMATLSAHVVRGLLAPNRATAFISSPSSGTDAPIAVKWGDASTGIDTGLRIVCFYGANTSAPRTDRPDWPRLTAVGLELPGSSSGFALVEPLDGNWDVVEGAEASLQEYGTVTADVAVVARVNPTGRTPGEPHAPRGIPPGQPGVRGSGTRFCISGPFPDRLPNLTTSDPADTIATTIEGLLNGVVAGFHGVDGNHPGTDAGVWFPSPPGTLPRQIPLYPE